MAEPNFERLVLNPPPNITRVSNLEDLEHLLEWLNSNKEIGWDIETDPNDNYYLRRCRTIQFGTSTRQFVIDLLQFCDNSKELYNQQGEYGVHLRGNLKILIDKLTPYLISEEWTKVGVSLQFEYMTMYFNFGVRSCGFWDCAVIEKVLYAGLQNLKAYHFFSMSEMVERYFHKSIDKSLQESFNLSDALSDSQIEYAALDTRTPLGIKGIQKLILQGHTVSSLKSAGKASLAEYLSRVDQLILGDNLEEVAAIENYCIGSFVDMMLHGERIDCEKWNKRIEEKKKLLAENVSEMDKILLPIVGSKDDNITDEQITEAETKWKKFNELTEEEIKLKGELRAATKNGDAELATSLTVKLESLKSARVSEKEVHKKTHGDMKKHRTAIYKLSNQCEGLALINYSSNAQLLKVLRENFKQLRKLESLDDKVLDQYKQLPIMRLIRTYHGLSKEIGTYGLQWSTEWVTKPGKEEGWISPHDHRIHSTFNQLDAATGRSSSERPNGQNIDSDIAVRSCFIADNPDEYGERVLITADLSGCELRIIAEAADDPVWINAFKRGEDLHSVGTELLFGEDWRKLTLSDCAYYKLNENGEPQHFKCKCNGHSELRNSTKAINFLISYGGGPSKLADSIGSTVSKAKELMAKHEAAFPAIWSYLRKSGAEAARTGRAFDMFGRRRIFPEPSYDKARENVKEYREDKLRLPEEEQKENIEAFYIANKRKPKKEEEWYLTHREPTSSETGNAYIAMSSSTERQGKNHRIQGTNASLIKLSMAKLWKILPKYHARLQKMVHDELVINCPKIYAEEVANIMQEVFKEASYTKLKQVVMESEYNIASFWGK